MNQRVRFRMTASPPRCKDAGIFLILATPIRGKPLTKFPMVKGFVTGDSEVNPRNVLSFVSS
jgi:hypothetical protein